MAGTIDRLAQLQNLIKRDPEAYVDEFRLQHKNFEAELAILRLRGGSSSGGAGAGAGAGAGSGRGGSSSSGAGGNSDSFRQLVMFLAHVMTCYRAELSEFPSQLISLLEKNAATLDGETRRTVAQALMLMRNRGAIEPLGLLKTFFGLFRVQDKYLRELIFTHIVNDVRNINGGNAGAGGAGGKGGKGGKGGGGSLVTPESGKVNRQIQAFIYGMLNDDSPVAAKRSLDVMIELYRRRVWTDARTVNVIATALLSPRTKLLVTALKFFLGLTGQIDDGGSDNDDDDDSSDEEWPRVQLDKKAVEAIKNENQHVKKTRKRLRATAKHLAAMRKAKTQRKGTGQPVFPAIQLLHDPQGLAEKMFGALDKRGERFEVRLLCLNFITRLVGQHRLILLPLYSYIQKYLAAHQQHVTQLLAYLIQACHDLVPPDELAPVTRAIAHSFVSDGSSAEAIQVGLNSLREIFARCPGVLAEEGMGDFVQDLVEYKRYKNKGVVAAARGVLNLVRDWYPALLRRKDRGKDVAMDGGKAGIRPTAYGAINVATGVEGAELLALALAQKAQRRKMMRGSEAGDWDEDGDDDGDEDDEDEDDLGEGSVTGSVDQADIAGFQDDDEWAKVERSKARALARAGKKLPRSASAGATTVAGSGASAAAAVGAGAGGNGSRPAKGKKAQPQPRRGDGEKDAADLAELLLAEDDEDMEDGHHHHHHHHDHAGGKRKRVKDEDEEDEEEDDEDEDDEEEEDEDGEEDEDDEDEDEDEDKDEDDEDEEDEEEDEEDEDEAPRSKRARGNDGRAVSRDDDDEDEDEDEDDELLESAHAHAHTGAGSETRSVGASSGLASRRAGLLAAIAPMLAGKGGKGPVGAGAGGGARLEATRILTPKDFARIKAIQAKLAERGVNASSTKEIMRLLASTDTGSSVLGGGSSAAGWSASEPEKKKRRGGRGLGVVDDDGNVISEDDEDDEDVDMDEDHLAMPGTSYAPAIISMNPMTLEAMETGEKRKQAERLADLLKSKAEGRKFEGTKPGGGTTNREKARRKNFLMLRKSGAVQKKLRSDLKAQGRAIRKRLQENAVRNRRTKMRRRRT
jgi:protein SDA1